MSKKYITVNVGSGLSNIWIGNVDCTPYDFTNILKTKIRILPYKTKHFKKFIISGK